MIKFDAVTVAVAITGLNGVACAARKHEIIRGKGKPVTKEMQANSLHVLSLVTPLGLTNGLTRSAASARNAEQQIKADKDVTSTKAHLTTVVHTLLNELREYSFLRVSRERRTYIDNEQLFGQLVYRTFTKARPDVKEAGNCLAAECNTAAVFHLMRVSEYGLRSVAKKLQVKLTHKGARQPIEYADWNKVITAIKIEIAEVRTQSSGLKQDRQLNFYSDIAEQSEYIKDIWRNGISHARRSYNSAEAHGVKVRVQEFMDRIARGPTHD